MLWHVPIQFKKEFKNKVDSNMWKKNLISLHEKMNLKVIGPKPIWAHFKNIFVFFTGCWCTLEWVEMSVHSIIYECKVCFTLFRSISMIPFLHWENRRILVVTSLLLTTPKLGSRRYSTSNKNEQKSSSKSVQCMYGLYYNLFNIFAI